MFLFIILFCLIILISFILIIKLKQGSEEGFPIFIYKIEKNVQKDFHISYINTSIFAASKKDSLLKELSQSNEVILLEKKKDKYSETSNEFNKLTDEEKKKLFDCYYEGNLQDIKLNFPNYKGSSVFGIFFKVKVKKLIEKKILLDKKEFYFLIFSSPLIIDSFYRFIIILSNELTRNTFILDNIGLFESLLNKECDKLEKLQIKTSLKIGGPYCLKVYEKEGKKILHFGEVHSIPKEDIDMIGLLHYIDNKFLFENNNNVGLFIEAPFTKPKFKAKGGTLSILISKEFSAIKKYRCDRRSSLIENTNITSTEETEEEIANYMSNKGKITKEEFYRFLEDLYKRKIFEHVNFSYERIYDNFFANKIKEVYIENLLYEKFQKFGKKALLYEPINPFMLDMQIFENLDVYNYDYNIIYTGAAHTKYMEEVFVKEYNYVKIFDIPCSEKVDTCLTLPKEILNEINEKKISECRIL